MHRASTAVALTFAACAFGASPASAAVGLFSPVLPVSPVVAPAQTEVQFQITGVGVDTSTPLKVVPGGVSSPFTDAVDSVGLGQEADRIRVLGPTGKLSVVSTAAASMLPSCNRGGVVNSTWTTYRLDVPAGETVTIAVRLDVPKGLPGSKPRFTLDYRPLAEPGKVAPALTPAPVTIPRTGSIDGLTLKAVKRTAGKVTLSGRLAPARRGAKVTFVAHPSSAQGVDSLFGQLGAALAPLGHGISKLGTTHTTKGGKFAATVKAPKGLAIVARTGGASAGASCGVHVG